MFYGGGGQQQVLICIGVFEQINIFSCLQKKKNKNKEIEHKLL